MGFSVLMLDRTCHVSLRFPGGTAICPGRASPSDFLSASQFQKTELPRKCRRLETGLKLPLVKYVTSIIQENAMRNSPEEKKLVIIRLRRIRGQAEALERAIEAGTDCAPLLQQIVTMPERPGEAVITVAANGRGLSVAAISYYVVGLLAYLIKGVPGLHDGVAPNWRFLPLFLLSSWRFGGQFGKFGFLIAWGQAH